MTKHKKFYRLCQHFQKKNWKNKKERKKHEKFSKLICTLEKNIKIKSENLINYSKIKIYKKCSTIFFLYFVCVYTFWIRVSEKQVGFVKSPHFVFASWFLGFFIKDFREKWFMISNPPFCSNFYIVSSILSRVSFKILTPPPKF